MNIYPSIDLIQGRVVRLTKGDFSNVVVYSDDPITVASQFADGGMKHLHVVDLDGARLGKVQQPDLIAKIVAATALEIQVGGGIRSEAQARAYLEAGVSRVVVGSLAVKDPEGFESLVKQIGADRITLAVDFTRDERGDTFVAWQGWQRSGNLPATELLSRGANYGIRHFLCTDISRDGMLSGPDVNLYREWQTLFPAQEVQVSGGVGCLEDLRNLKQNAARAVIVGKALYEGKIKLSEVLLC
jgi:phosphoribosylformimino-5-aminoimidazole carboxamide ribotide isomerase